MRETQERARLVAVRGSRFLSEQRALVLAVAMVGFLGCATSPPPGSRAAIDIVEKTFPEAQAAIRAQMETVVDAARRHDWDALRSAHLETSKFTKFGRGAGRETFEEMIATEIAGISGMTNPSIDFRDLKLDVFGDVAVSTSFPLITWSNDSGETVEVQIRSTVVWVKTAEGWKMAHEHNTPVGEQREPVVTQPID